MLDRRDLLLAGAGVFAATALPAAASASSGHGPHHEGHGAAAPDRPHGDLAHAIAGCLEAGEVCRQHCLDILTAGDTSMAACAVAVADMLAVCEATRALALANSPILPELRVACRKACTACEEACRKHAEHHAACKGCADACAATLKVV